MVLIAFLAICVYYYYYVMSSSDQSNLLTYLYTWTINFFEDPNTVFFTVIFIFMFYAVVYLCRIPMTNDTKPISIAFVENKLWVLLATLAILDFSKYMLGIDLLSALSNIPAISNWLGTTTPSPVTTGSPVTNAPMTAGAPVTGAPVAGAPVASCPGTTASPSNPTDQVFNISNNMYTYDDAQAICMAYGARLATYDEVEGAYDNGGEWCNYGWSADQMALFPTQKSTWANLQKSEKTKHACGRPGVNGGYIADAKLKFGINCFGQKPSATNMDLARMDATTAVVAPKSPDDLVLDAKVDYWKKHASSLLIMNPYNKKKWSEY
jgi:hypothetical protein